MGKRIYIISRGTTDRALTGVENDLPSPDAPAHWHFWMQSGPLQQEHDGANFPFAPQRLQAMLRRGASVSEVVEAIEDADRREPRRRGTAHELLGVRGSGAAALQLLLRPCRSAARSAR
jgi:hypothetical protein